MLDIFYEYIYMLLRFIFYNNINLNNHNIIIYNSVE